MPDRKTGNSKDNADPKSEGSNEAPLKWAGEIVVTPEAEPVEVLEEKPIHPRRPMPLVPEGPARDEEGAE